MAALRSEVCRREWRRGRSGARTPAGRPEGATYYYREAPTRRPASHLPQGECFLTMARLRKAGRGDEEVYQRVIASTRLRRRHSGRAQREPEPIGRFIVWHGPVLVLNRSRSRTGAASFTAAHANPGPGRAAQWVPGRRSASPRWPGMTKAWDAAPSYPSRHIPLTARNRVKAATAIRSRPAPRPIQMVAAWLSVSASRPRSAASARPP